MHREQLKNFLRLRRIRLRLGARKAAAKLGVGKSTLYDWEKGSHKPRRELIPIISKVYQVDMAKLLEMVYDYQEDHEE